MYKITDCRLCFYISNLSHDRHFRWSSKPREGLAICTEKGDRHFSVILRPWVLVRLWESNPRPPALQFLILDTELHFVIQLRNTLKIIHEIFYFHFWLIFKTNKKTKILNVHFIQMNTSRNHVSDELRLKFNDSKGTANKWIWSAKITLGKKYKPESKCFLCILIQS